MPLPKAKTAPSVPPMMRSPGAYKEGMKKKVMPPGAMPQLGLMKPPVSTKPMPVMPLRKAAPKKPVRPGNVARKSAWQLV